MGKEWYGLFQRSYVGVDPLYLVAYIVAPMAKRPSFSVSQAVYHNRRKRIIRQLKGAAAIFAAPLDSGRGDDGYLPGGNKDLFYLTGFSEPDTVLILLGNSRGPRSVLFLRDRDAQDERWHGERLGIKRARRLFAVDEIRDISRLRTDLPEMLSSSHTLYYAPGSNPRLDSVVWNMFRQPGAPRVNGPNALIDSRVLTSEMRFIKDRDEIRAIQHACDITSRALLWLIPRTREFASERHAAQLLESQFARLGAHGVAFPTIAASGRNATVLHHRPRLQPLWRRELVMFDCGASFQGYASDVTRTYPASGRFSQPQADVYDVVLAAHDRVIERARPGVTLDELHQVATRTIVKGLVDLGILRGSPGAHFDRGTYRPYFMHRIAHWLGLDVHDIAPVSVPGDPRMVVPSMLRPVVPGCVFTVEPGLYFDPKDESVPVAFRGIGIRIEDDVLITNEGATVLTSSVPTARADIENLFPPG